MQHKECMLSLYINAYIHNVLVSSCAFKCTESNGSSDEVDLEGPATDEDIMTGLKIFQAIVYCPSMDIKVFKFVDKLLIFCRFVDKKDFDKIEDKLHGFWIRHILL